MKPEDLWGSALDLAASTIELYDDATMKGDYMLDASECAAIIRALKGIHPAPAVMQEPVHFRAVICKEQQEQALGVVPKIVGFVDKKAAEQFILEQRDFKGWKYNLEPLYTEAPAVAQLPADVVRELFSAAQGALKFMEQGCTGCKVELDSDRYPCHTCNRAEKTAKDDLIQPRQELIDLRAALKSAKEHGL